MFYDWIYDDANNRIVVMLYASTDNWRDNIGRIITVFPMNAEAAASEYCNARNR